MSALMKYARNELVFGSSGQEPPDGITVGPRKTPKGRNLLGQAIGTAIGFSIPAVLEVAKAVSEGRKIQPVSFGSLVGAGVGAVIGRNH